LTLGIYAHVGLFDQSAALDALPDLTLPKTTTEPETTALAATGTDGRPISKLIAHHLPTGGDGEQGVVMDSDVIINWDARTMTTEPRSENKASDASRWSPTQADGAEGVGFEPTDGLHHLRFSRPSQSTTLAPLPRKRRARQPIGKLGSECPQRA